jgi:hypothetical protein
MKGYPRWFLPTLIGTLLLILVSGLLLAPTTLLMRAELALAWRLPPNIRMTMAALHAVGGFAAMLLIGAVWSVHMRSGWRRQKHRASGLTLALMLLILCTSAVAIYYLVDEMLAALTAFLHLAVGMALVFQLGWHWARGRRSHSQRETAFGAAHRHKSSL